MTDTSPTDQTTTPGLAQDQIDGMRAAWQAQGLDMARFDAALAGTHPNAPPPAADPGVAMNTGAEKHASLSASEARQMADALLAAGVSPEAVDAALKADGFEESPEDTRTDDEKAWDAVFAGAKPEDFRINYHGLVPAETPLADVIALNQAGTEWAAQVGLTAEVGSAVIERALTVGRALDAMPSPDRTLWITGQRQQFERMAGGPEKAAERLALAASALKRGGKAFTAGLLASGALHDAFVVAQLANHAERTAARSASGVTT